MRYVLVRRVAEAAGEPVTIDADSWADKRYTLWATPDVTPFSIAGMSRMIGATFSWISSP
jgi:hypothetical protein